MARGGTEFTEKHQANSRYPVGVQMSTRLTGEEMLVDIGGYHNQGPRAGAGERASEVKGAAISAGVHLLIGDFNIEPPGPRAEGAMSTRRSGLQEATEESNEATSKGGSYYDRAELTDAELGNRELRIANKTGSRFRSSDHQVGYTEVTSRRRR
jgi:hypothetical protein